MNPWPIGTLTQLQTINLRSCLSLVSLWPALTQSFPYSWVTDMGEINWGWGAPVTVAFYLSRKRLEKGPPIFKQCFIGTWAPRNHPPTHLRDYYPVWLSKRTPIYLMFPASKKCQMGTAGKRILALDSKIWQNEDVTNSQWKVGSFFPPLYSLPLGSIFCLSTCAGSCREAGICFSAPRTAISWQPGRQREPKLGASMQPNKYLLSTSWGQAHWRIQRFMWSRPSNNLIPSSHQHS